MILLGLEMNKLMLRVVHLQSEGKNQQRGVVVVIKEEKNLKQMMINQKMNLSLTMKRMSSHFSLKWRKGLRRKI